MLSIYTILLEEYSLLNLTLLMFDNVYKDDSFDATELPLFDHQMTMVLKLIYKRKASISFIQYTFMHYLVLQEMNVNMSDHWQR